MFQSSVEDLMRRDPVIISGESTLRDAAIKMASVKCGALPVGTAERVEGIITDRDIVIRAIARGKDPAKEKVRDYMTPEVYTCRPGETPERAAGIMREKGVSRILVEDQTGRTCGIITFGAIVRKAESMQDIANVIECAVGRKAA